MSLRARHGPLWILPAGTFLVFGLATLRDYGMTWDEAESWNAATSNLALLRGSQTTPTATHVLPGYYFAVDTIRGLFVEGVGGLFPFAAPDDVVVAQHAFNLLLASASIGLLYSLILQISGRPRMAISAAAALGLMPAFVGHAQNNPKDLPALFAFLLAACCIAGLARASTSESRRGAWPWVAAGALSIGLALTTRALCVTLVPILGGWVLWRRRAAYLQKPRHWLALAAGGGVMAFALWPWLWDAPFAKIGLALERISIHELVDFKIIYLGELQSWSQMPWHYRPVHFLATLPLVHLGLCALSLAAARHWSKRRDARLDVVALACVWLGVLAVVDQLAPYRYDGIRHFLPALPAVAMLVAAGCEWLMDAAAGRAGAIASLRLRAALSSAPVVACAIVAALQLASTHPHQSAFLNLAANSIAGPHSEEWLELEYWGQAYQDGGRWIDANTERDAIVYLPIGDKVASYYARRPGGVWRQFEARFSDTARPQYVMFITRLGFYDEAVHRLERDYEPVYSLQVQNATLLKIYSNRARREVAAEPSHG